MNVDLLFQSLSPLRASDDVSSRNIEKKEISLDARASEKVDQRDE